MLPNLRALVFQSTKIWMRWKFGAYKNSQRSNGMHLKWMRAQNKWKNEKLKRPSLKELIFLSAKIWKRWKMLSPQKL